MVVTGWETVEALALTKSIIECQLFNNHIVIRMKKIRNRTCPCEKLWMIGLWEALCWCEPGALTHYPSPHIPPRATLILCKVLGPLHTCLAIGPHCCSVFFVSIATSGQLVCDVVRHITRSFCVVSRSPFLSMFSLVFFLSVVSSFALSISRMLFLPLGVCVT